MYQAQHMSHLLQSESQIWSYFVCSRGKGLGFILGCLGASLGKGKAGAKVRMLGTKVVRRACAGQTPPFCFHKGVYQ